MPCRVTGPHTEFPQEGPRKRIRSAIPGLFFVLPDQTLYFASIQTMPFARPPLDGVLGALDFVAGKNYPARGEYTGPV